MTAPTEDDRSNLLLAQVDRGALGLVQELFRNVARALRLKLVNRINDEVDVRFAGVEVVHLGRVLDRFSTQDGAVFATLTVGPQRVPCLVSLQGPLLSELVAQLLGSHEDDSRGLAPWRPVTRVDLRLAERILSDLIECIQVSLAPESEPEIVLESITSNTRVRLSLPRGTSMIESTLDFGPPDSPFGLASCWIPGHLTSYLWPHRSGRMQQASATPEEGLARVMPVPVEAVVELARITLPIGKVKSLEVGDLLPLGAVRNVTMRVGNKQLFVGEPGEQAGNRSMRIDKRNSITMDD